MPTSTPIARVSRWASRRAIGLLTATVTVVMTGMITHGHHALSGDALHYMIAARSAAFDRDLDLGNDYADPERILHVPPDDHARVGRNGVLRPAHDVGWPILAAPVVAVGERLALWSDRLPESLRRRARLDPFIALRQFTSLVMIGLTVWLARLVYRAALPLADGRILAVLGWTLAWTLSPPILSHGYVFFTEVPSAIAAMWLFGRRDALRVGIAPARALLLGFVTGALVLVHVRNVGLALGLALVTAWPVRATLRRAVPYGIGFAVAATAKLGLNSYFWGTPVGTPHERVGAWVGSAGGALIEPALRSLGLLFDPRHGLLWAAPIYLLLPAAWWLLRRRDRATAIAIAVLTVSTLVFILLPWTNTHGWRGGWSPAARFLVPLAPLFALALMALANVRLNLLVGVVLAAQLWLDATFWSRPMLFWNEGPGPAAHVQALFGERFAASLPAWERFDTPVVVWSVAALAGWALLTWLVVWLAQPKNPDRESSKEDSRSGF